MNGTSIHIHPVSAPVADAEAGHHDVADVHDGHPVHAAVDEDAHGDQVEEDPDIPLAHIGFAQEKGPDHAAHGDEGVPVGLAREQERAVRSRIMLQEGNQQKEHRHAQRQGDAARLPVETADGHFLPRGIAFFPVDLDGFFLDLGERVDAINGRRDVIELDKRH